MTGFELTAFGPVPLGTPYLDPKTTTLEQAAQYVVSADYGHGQAPAVTPIVELQQQTPAQVLTQPPRATVLGRSTSTAGVIAQVTAAPTTPGSVIKAAKARVKEIKAELKRMRALQKELGELERLLIAAKQKPTASVRPLRSVG